MHEETYKGFILQRADSERTTKDVVRRVGKRMKKQPGKSWYVKDASGRVLDSRLTRASARRAVNAMLEDG